ncbi:disintegrin and metalloproteinase domain-containing protein 10-like isoform X2 [Mytilus californianus]|uniref:disintegrin and metalloproteinase domain-containing protein 10-like isoform X2 n=1 Tax=Mytilus californianus TaxID=6549 RepID=UPI0022459983|nr:disintegrin and metalloproteinase domain-containing protein 10-like isoform X2 [Mytilus californianus]
MKSTWIYILFQSLVCVYHTEQKSLDTYIKHYEELDYSTSELHQSHLRTKRSLSDKKLRFKFSAFKRDFNLVLEPDKLVFTKDAWLDKHGPLDTSHIYRGTEEGSGGSSVFGYIVDGHFRGTIRIPQDTTYHIEPVKRFIGRVKELPKSHTIIYKEEHIDLDPHRLRREAENAIASCGNGNRQVHEWMETVANSADTENYRVRRSYSEDKEAFSYHNKYSEALNREKRGTLVDKNACFLFMQADPKLYNKVYSAYKKDVLAKEDIVGTFASHVDAINTIYSNTVFKTFDNSINYSGVRFKIQRTKIMTPTSEGCSSSQPKTLCSDNIDVSNFLNENSLINHSAFCLAYIFTYRDFTQGTLGLAWVGSSGQASGGICEKYKSFPEGGKQVMKSLNTGIVTLVNYGDDVAPRVSQLTFAHEVGHNFGSPHDSGQQCAPYGTGASDASQGNYIMYASATKGNQPHNDEFSPCSKDNMTRVMDAVFNGRYGKVNCFQNDNAAFCGNSIVEAGEECDCGYKEDCTDGCCAGRDSNGDGCTLTSGSSCSPSQGGCCDPVTCAPVTDGRQCRPQTDCAAASNCAGQATCPNSTAVPDYITYCNDYSKVCVQGICTGSLCSKVDYTAKGNKVTWVECFVEAPGDTVADKETQCLLGCKLNNSNTCYSSANDAGAKPSPFTDLLNEIKTNKGDQNYKVELPAGSPCNKYQGYCDVFKRCRGVDAEGPLSRLKNLLFSSETFTNIKDWITEYWWAVILIAIGLILFMGLFIKVCAVHTPSSNPKAPPAQNWGDTLRRRRSHPRSRQQQQHSGYSQEPLRQQHSPHVPLVDYK